MQTQYLVFDGECGLCHGWVRFVLRHDQRGEILFVPAASATGQSLLLKHGLSVEKLDTMLYVQGDKAWQKSDAFIQIIRRLPFPVSLLAVFVIVPRFMRDAVYDRVARHRYKLFGKRDVCQLLNGDDRERFIQ